MPYSYELDNRKTGVKKFIDHLMEIYDDSIRSSNPSWKAGRRMFDNKLSYYEKNKDYSGFKSELTDHEQNAQVTKHILGHAGVLLTGRGLDNANKLDIIPGRKDVGELIGYGVSGVLQLTDILQKFWPIGDKIHIKGQADVEILNNYVARDVANAFTRAYKGNYSREQLKRKLLQLLER